MTNNPNDHVLVTDPATGMTTIRVWKGAVQGNEFLAVNALIQHWEMARTMALSSHHQIEHHGRIMQGAHNNAEAAKAALEKLGYVIEWTPPADQGKSDV